MKTKKEKRKESKNIYFSFEKGSCRTHLAVPSTDPHGFELDENLELTDSSC